MPYAVSVSEKKGLTFIKESQHHITST